MKTICTSLIIIFVVILIIIAFLIKLLGWDSNIQLGDYHARKGNYEKAIYYYSEELKISDEHFLHLKIGMCYEMAGDFPKAITKYSDYAKYSTNTSRSLGYLYRGHAYYQLHEYQKACDDWVQFMNDSIKTTRYDIFTDFCHIPKVAYLESFTQALKNQPTKVEYYIFRASVYKSMKRFGEAMEDCNTAVKLDESNPLPYFIRGEIYEKQGDDNQATNEFQRAFDLSPSPLKESALNHIKILATSGSIPR
jgi:tetratricopeptide (TPR) repeat protein